MISCEPQEMQRRDRDPRFHVKTTVTIYLFDKMSTCELMYSPEDNSLTFSYGIENNHYFSFNLFNVHPVTSTILIF